jgi:hypothetical protein
MPTASYAELDRLSGELLPERAVLGLATPFGGGHHGAAAASSCTVVRTAGAQRGMIAQLLSSLLGLAIAQAPSGKFVVHCGSIAAAK